MDMNTLVKKARYGHKSYLYWYEADGTLSYGLYNKANWKRAILSVGLHGRVFWLDASTATSNIARTFGYMIHLWRCASPSVTA